jgi:c-di-AMP phosphodiesterase-like protein
MSKQESDNVFWIYDPMILFRDGNYLKIFPTKDMTQIQVLNALTRLCIYLAIIFVLVSAISGYAYVPIIFILIIIVIYFFNNNKNSVQTEMFDDNYPNTNNSDNIDNTDNIMNKQNYKKISDYNPYMNLTLNDIGSGNDDLEANLVELPKDSNRKFYTTSSTNAANAKTTYAIWYDKYD